MMKTIDTAPNLAVVRERVHELREKFGDCDWLRVVGGVTAEGYRLAGFSPGEFGALLRAETEKRGRLLIHLRRKEIMRLRAGFDGATGGVTEEDGFAHLHLHFEAGHYDDMNFDPKLDIIRTVSSSLALVGGLGRPIAALRIDGVPRCLLRGGGRMVGGVTATRYAWGTTMTTIRPTRRLETLGLMPDTVAKFLGVEPQRTLGHIPWLAYEAEPAHELPSRTPAPAPVAERKRPALRVVGS